MANENFSILRGKESNLPSTKTAGTVYITTDTGKIFLDDSSTSRIQLNAVDDSLLSTSENAVQNKVVNAALSNKADSEHTHNYAGSSSAGGSANSADKLTTARTINGISFDGSKNITVPMNSTLLSSSQNLDNVKTVGFYHATGSNAITNKPSSVDAFGLEVIQSASGWYTQVLYASNNVMKSYRRWYNGSSWTSWTEDKLTDTVYTLPTASSTELGGVKTTSAVTSSSGYTACPIISGVPYYKDTNTVYTHPSYTSRSNGLYKVTVDNKGHVSNATTVTKSDITGLGIASNIKISPDSTTANPTYTGSVDNPYLVLTNGSSVLSNIQIKGSGLISAYAGIDNVLNFDSHLPFTYEHSTCPLTLTQNNTGITSTCTCEYYILDSIIGLSAEFNFSAITNTDNSITITGFPVTLKGTYILSCIQWGASAGGPAYYGVIQSDGSMLVLVNTHDTSVSSMVSAGMFTNLSFNIVATIV